MPKSWFHCFCHLSPLPHDLCYRWDSPCWLPALKDIDGHFPGLAIQEAVGKDSSSWLSFSTGSASTDLIAEPKSAEGHPELCSGKVATSGPNGEKFVFS
ncbi:hypothetical protein CapIbe_007355 [Capra ibex]